MTAVVVFKCHPVEAAWDPLRTSKNQCLLFGTFVLGYELSNVMIDLIILCLPIYMIRQLHLPARQRWILSLIFLLGGLQVYFFLVYERCRLTKPAFVLLEY